MESVRSRAVATTSSISANTSARRCHLLEGAATHDGRKRCTERIAGAVVTGESRVGGRARFAMRNSVGEQRLFGIERIVLAGVGDAGGIEFGHLEAEQIDLARPQPFVPSEGGERRIDLGEPGPRGSQRCEVDRAELIECGTLGRHREQTLVGVLAVQIDHVGGEFGQRRHGGGTTVDVRTGAPIGGDHPAQDRAPCHRRR